jgi:hypothetical protein
VATTSCEACEIGKYQVASGSDHCLPCQHGTASPLTSQTTCVTCTAGTYSIGESSSQCAKCATDGMNCETGMARIEDNYWAYSINVTSTIDIDNATKVSVVNRQLEILSCIQGRCLGGTYSALGYTPCGKNRLQTLDNIMCGSCLPHHVEYGTDCIGNTPRTPRLLVMVADLCALNNRMHTSEWFNGSSCSCMHSIWCVFITYICTNITWFGSNFPLFWYQSYQITHAQSMAACLSLLIG